MTHYDLVIIGTGSGNTILDDRFEGWRVAIVEEGAYGGTCLNRGCIPSKMYVVPATIAHDAADEGPRLGLRTSYDGADWRAMRDRVFGRIDPLARQGHEYRVGQSHVDAIDGRARFTGARALVVSREGETDLELTADHVLIAVGSRPVVPDVPGLDAVPYETSDTVMRLDALPARIGVVGGGYVGSEFANVFASLGTQVVQVDSAPRLIDNHDREVADHFTELAGRRWDLRLDAGLEKVERTDSGSITMHLGDGSRAEVDVLLLAVGRTPNADLLDLDGSGSGVEVDDAGRVVVDEHQRTTADGVWALGDVSSPQPLKHVANQDARVVQHNLLNPDGLRVSDHRFVPSAVFASPQVAAVGLTEEQAREQGLDLAVGRSHYADTAHGWAMETDDRCHFAKVLADRATGRLVGAHLIGPQASVLVQPLIQAMSFDQPVVGLARGMYWIHPALSEVVETALLALEEELVGEKP
ncbi:Mycothione reductase [Nocardioides aquaticus]|uniref:Mycothione reductase n=1 Tax=Nocardioides aquaticus TaxID=160826 RepID=A0ABX8EGB9_9ACTN|nr:mycothione reductase [Nocardioides aquaticus]QVT78122.1 Mycothione reductase [Nocardioides aquaticus]